MTRSINIWMIRFDNHRSRRCEEDGRRLSGIGLGKPESSGYVIDDSGVKHRDCSLRLEEVDSPTVVMGEMRCFGDKRRKRLR